MNKVDQLVRYNLLAYPNLYQNRFEVLAEVFFNSCYEWDENGCIAYIFEKKPVTPETMVAQFEEKVANTQQEIQKWHEQRGDTEDYLAKLHTTHLTTDLQNLHHAKFVAENIDVFASTYCGVSHSQYWAWLHYQDRHGISNYGCINHPPEVIDEDWRAAIYEWTKQMLPSLNSLFGVYYEKKGWIAQERYEKIFNWVYQTNRRYESEKETEVRISFSKEIQKILTSAEGERDSTDST